MPRRKIMILIVICLSMSLILPYIIQLKLPKVIEQADDIDEELILTFYDASNESIATLTTTLRDLGYEYENEVYIMNVREYNQTSNPFKRLYYYFKNNLSSKGSNKIILNKSKQSRDFDKVVSTADTEPIEQQVSYNWETGEITYTPAQAGIKYTLKRPSVYKKGTVCIKSAPNPSMYSYSSTQQLSVLGKASTTYTGELDLSRNKNMAVAIQKLNGSKINPKGIFSMYQTISPFTKDEGYEEAGVIKGDEVSQALGGGICQVTTTLYNAVLRAELSVIERHNHSTQVKYIAPSYDATVAGKYVDFKFQNMQNQPVYIFMNIGDGKIKAVVVGVESRPADRYISFESMYDEETASYNLYKFITTESGTQMQIMNTSKYKEG